MKKFLWLILILFIFTELVYAKTDEILPIPLPKPTEYDRTQDARIDKIEDVNIQQDENIINLQNDLSLEISDRINNDNNLNTAINKEIKNREQADKKLNKKINKVDNQSKQRDKKLQSNIDKETKERKKADKQERQERITGDNLLQNTINDVNINSINRDNDLTSAISLEKTQRIESFNFVNDYINNVDTKQTNWNKQQDQSINNLNNIVSNHEQRIGNLENRVGDLEDTQYNVRGEVKFIREKNYEVGIYSKFNANRSTCSEVGLSITIGLGKSWTEREIEKVNAKVAKLEKMLEQHVVNVKGEVDGEKVEVTKTKTDEGITYELNKPATVKFLKKF